MDGFLAYGIATLLLLHSQSFIVWFIAIILIIKGTFNLKEFWIDIINTSKGLMFFMRSLIKDIINKFRKDRNANGK